MTHDEMIAVIQAHKDGATIEYKRIDTYKDWRPAIAPSWDFAGFDYRVKDQPIKRVAKCYDTGNELVWRTFGYSSDWKRIPSLDKEWEE